MSADSMRKHSKQLNHGQVILPQAINDPSILESVAGFIHEVVPQAYSSVLPGEFREGILWAKFEYVDYNNPDNFPQLSECESESTLPLLLVLGYSSGVQVWSIGGSGEATELLSWCQGSVRALRFLLRPTSRDPHSSKRPLVAIVDSSSPGPQFSTLSFVSLRTAEVVKIIKFNSPICDVLCNRKSIVVTFNERIAVFDSATLEDRLTITTCYLSPGNSPNPVALGNRWLAYGEKRLTTWQRSSGGCEGDGAQSYTSAVIHAAKSLGKGLRDLGGSLTGNSNQASQNAHAQPGVVSVIDIEKKCGNSEEDRGNMVAHFVAHTSAVVAMSFDPSGLVLITADKHGHRFNVFRMHPHPCTSQLAAVHHLYILHRGETTARVQDIAVSWDSRWVAISSVRGTTHVFPITPYGGLVTVRTHTTPQVVNRLSRFERSAGLRDGRGSPLPCEIPPTPPPPRLPPYPHPSVITPLAQLRSRPDDFPLAATFGPPRAWLPGKPKSKRTCADSLYVISSSGVLIQYDLDPKCIQGIPKEKISYDTSIELGVEAKAEWVLPKPPLTNSLCPPLPPGHALLDFPPQPQPPPDKWLSQVEIVTHTGPHRRLWMGPQINFKSIDPLPVSGCEESGLDSGNPLRSNPVNMPHRPFLLVEASSGGSVGSPQTDSDEAGGRLREDLADAMLETQLTSGQARRRLKKADMEWQVNPLGILRTHPTAAIAHWSHPFLVELSPTNNDLHQQSTCDTLTHSAPLEDTPVVPETPDSHLSGGNSQIKGANDLENSVDVEVSIEKIKDELHHSEAETSCIMPKRPHEPEVSEAIVDEKSTKASSRRVRKKKVKKDPQKLFVGDDNAILNTVHVPPIKIEERSKTVDDHVSKTIEVVEVINVIEEKISGCNQIISDEYEKNLGFDVVNENTDNSTPSDLSVSLTKNNLESEIFNTTVETFSADMKTKQPDTSYDEVDQFGELISDCMEEEIISEHAQCDIVTVSNCIEVEYNDNENIQGDLEIDTELFIKNEMNEFTEKNVPPLIDLGAVAAPAEFEKSVFENLDTAISSTKNVDFLESDLNGNQPLLVTFKENNTPQELLMSLTIPNESSTISLNDTTVQIENFPPLEPTSLSVMDEKFVMVPVKSNRSNKNKRRKKDKKNSEQIQLSDICEIDSSDSTLTKFQEVSITEDAQADSKISNLNTSVENLSFKEYETEKSKFPETILVEEILECGPEDIAPFSPLKVHRRIEIDDSVMGLSGVSDIPSIFTEDIQSDHVASTDKSEVEDISSHSGKESDESKNNKKERSRRQKRSESSDKDRSDHKKKSPSPSAGAKDTKDSDSSDDSCPVLETKILIPKVPKRKKGKKASDEIQEKNSDEVSCDLNVKGKDESYELIDTLPDKPKNKIPEKLNEQGVCRKMKFGSDKSVNVNENQRSGLDDRDSVYESCNDDGASDSLAFESSKEDFDETTQKEPVLELTASSNTEERTDSSDKVNQPISKKVKKQKKKKR